MDKTFFTSSIQSEIHERRKANKFAIEILEGGTMKYRSGVAETLKGCINTFVSCRHIQYLKVSRKILSSTHRYMNLNVNFFIIVVNIGVKVIETAYQSSVRHTY
jgi:hypothetical protein